MANISTATVVPTGAHLRLAPLYFSFMQPLDQWPLASRSRIQGVLTDIDDTLTADGAITPEALKALGDLKAAGLHVFAVTGRPAGWSEPFALEWPIDAIVAENGSVALWRGEDGNLQKAYMQSEIARRRNFERLLHVAKTVLTALPHARLATDSAGRETDIAVDHSEFEQLPPEDIARVVRIMQAAGLNATVSSIHINGWIGEHDKVLGARWIIQQQLGRNLDGERRNWAYVGDSTNDAGMFHYMTHTVGVANIQRFADQLPHLPAYVTELERGAGFAQVAQAILEAR
jgi:HAD superfamily hydrolase (TIGR01484 family)